MAPEEAPAASEARAGLEGLAEPPVVLAAQVEFRNSPPVSAKVSVNAKANARLICFGSLDVDRANHGRQGPAKRRQRPF